MIAKCDYYGCPMDATEDLPPQKGMRFCPDHACAFAARVREGTPKDLIQFWIAAHGGARRFANVLLGEEG